jgi:nucleotide-binding universal stress UspA family protein
MPPLAVCAVDHDEHVEDVVAVARWLEASQAFTPRYLHVTRGVAVTGLEHAEAPCDDAPGEFEVDAPVEVLAGGVADALERRADELGAALFVIGSRGRGALACALTGSVSRTLATHGTRPVLVARQGSSPELGDGPVVCGVTRPLAQARRVARTAAGLARRLERPLLLVMVVPETVDARMLAGTSSRTAYRELAADRELTTSFLDDVSLWLDVPGGIAHHMVVGSPPATLEHVARERRSALLVVGCRGLGVFGTMMEGSVSRALIREARRPLVVVPLRHAS